MTLLGRLLIAVTLIAGSWEEVLPGKLDDRRAVGLIVPARRG
jgi:hypothetical protein